MSMNTKHSIRKQLSSRTAIGLVLSCMLLVIGGCSSSDSDSSSDEDEIPNSQNNTTSFEIKADDTQQLSPSGSSAAGTGTLALDTETGALSGSVTITGMVVTAAHIHEGFAGSDGGVIIALDASGETLTVPEGTVLDAAQMAAMNAGNYYVNVHSEGFPSGEIRAQITPDDVDVILAALSGENEVPPVTSSAQGTAFVTINRTTGAIVISAITTGLTTPESAHLHSAFAGSNGGVSVPLVQSDSEVGRFSSANETVLEAGVLTDLLAGGTYVNIHSAENPSGELRGQVLPSGVSVLSSTLSGEQEVAAVATIATGRGFVTLNENDATLMAIISTTGVDDATAAHIHEAAVGVNGGVMFALEQDSSAAGIWSAAITGVTTAQVSTLKAGGSYFNVHTPANASGEIRGQIEP